MRSFMTATSNVYRAAAVIALSTLWTGLAWAQDAKGQALTPPTAAAGGSGWSAEVAGGSSGITLDEKQTAIVKKVTAYFSTLENLKGSFVQTGADKKRMKGKFYVKRPGRFRFDYSLPSKQIIISDGQNLAVQDHDINTEDRVSLDQTAFRLLLRQDVDLVRDAKITEIQSDNDLVIVALQDKNPDTPGAIRLFFAVKPEFELKEWETLDAQGLKTQVEVSDLNKTEQIDASLFKIQPMGLNRTTPQ
ncbi:MAG: outer membrane lipoprotein carrier protein LolA [Hyphomicrobiaceae bacterium]|nr:outer membrane lipoprotein carrier protein LolA [Hyphomicrobiaceae bacterium]